MFQQIINIPPARFNQDNNIFDDHFNQNKLNNVNNYNPNYNKQYNNKIHYDSNRGFLKNFKIYIY